MPTNNPPPSGQAAAVTVVDSAACETCKGLNGWTEVGGYWVQCTDCWRLAPPPSAATALTPSAGVEGRILRLCCQSGETWALVCGNCQFAKVYASDHDSLLSALRAELAVTKGLYEEACATAYDRGALESAPASAREACVSTTGSPQSAREDLERGAGAWLSEGERRLRKMLAFAYSGHHLYGDDGELHDSQLPFPIDYMRDSIVHIETAIYNRGMAALAANHAHSENREDGAGDGAHVGKGMRP